MIDILTDSAGAFRASNRFILGRMAQAASVPVRALGPHDPAGLGAALFVHVNLTDVPADWLTVATSYDHVINGAATSIDRRQYSKARLAQGDDYDGPVIIKTVLNHRGIPELRHSLRGSWQGRLKRLAYRTVWKSRWDGLCPDYQVLDHCDQVSAEIWQNPALIVERFVPGRADPPVVKHRWEFFDDLSLVTRSVFGDALCRPDSFLEVAEVADVPDELQVLRKRLNLDFGSIDYFETQDGVVPIDCNKTTTSDDEWIAAYPFIGKYIADGGALLSDYAKGKR